MMSEKRDIRIPAVVIAGTGSGTGKTSVTLGLARALVRRGLRVQPFKVGPDFLDPTWHRRASGRESYNLDGWMTDHEYVTRLFARRTVDADCAIVEGVMGMFDGASPTELTGSTAEVALWLDAPVVLVVNAWGLAGTIAALVKGFVEFEPRVRVAGVVANFCGSAGHAKLLDQALAARDLPPLLGWLPRDGLPALPDRHLGLRAAFTIEENEAMIDTMADVCAEGIDLDRLLEVASTQGEGGSKLPQASPLTMAPHAPTHPSGRIAIARDEAFYFYYPDNLELLGERGAELIEFSPLRDAELPEGVDLLYIGGGYPEEYAAELEANTSMRASIAAFAGRGFIYAECGGLMYLSRDLTTRDGTSRAMVGALPFGTRMLDLRKMLGYVETRFTGPTLFGDIADEPLRGHEFHYSEIVDEDVAATGGQWRKVYSLRGRRSGKERVEGFFNGRVLASYVHQHFGSNPAALDRLLAFAAGALQESHT